MALTDPNLKHSWTARSLGRALDADLLPLACLGPLLHKLDGTIGRRLADVALGMRDPRPLAALVAGHPDGIHTIVSTIEQMPHQGLRWLHHVDWSLLRPAHFRRLASAVPSPLFRLGDYFDQLSMNQNDQDIRPRVFDELKMAKIQPLPPEQRADDLTHMPAEWAPSTLLIERLEHLQSQNIASLSSRTGPPS